MATGYPEPFPTLAVFNPFTGKIYFRRNWAKVPYSHEILGDL